MSVIHLKLKIPDETRRIQVATTTSVSELREIISNCFKISQQHLRSSKQIPENFSLRYEDEEKDLISIVTDSDWSEAIHFANNNAGYLVLLIGEPLPQAPAKEELEDEISKLEKEFIFLSSLDAPKEIIEQAIEGAKEMLETAKEKIQTIFEEIPKAGNEIQNFLSAQGQNAEHVIFKLQEMIQKNDAEPPKLSAILEHDVTIGDGEEINANSTFTKTWRLKNNGNCAWPKGTTIKPISAIRLSPEAVHAVPDLAAGESIDFAIQMTAPAEPGKFRSFYRLFHPESETPFGDIFWVDIVVPVPYLYQSQLDRLKEMGYEESVARFLLDDHKGNLDDCVAELSASILV